MAEICNSNNIEFMVPDETSRIINVFGDIDSSMSKEFFTQLNAIDTSDENIKIQNNFKLSKYNITCDDMKFPPINVYLNSPGGYIYDGLAMYDLVKNRDDIYCIGMGLVASSALFFMLGFKYENRVAYENTSFLVHQASSWTAGRCADMEEDLKETKRLNDIIFNIISKNTKITQAQLEKIYKQKRDLWLDANEAYKYGIISKII